MWQFWHSTFELQNIEPIDVWFDETDGCIVTLQEPDNDAPGSNGTCVIDTGVAIELVFTGITYELNYVDEFDVP